MHFLFAILILVDQVTKTAFAGRDFFFWGLQLHPMRNYGLPFGIDLGQQANFFILFFAYAIVGWMVLRAKLEGRRAHWGKSLFLAGAASNLADRLVYGYVRDFIDLDLGFVFNLADIFIVTGLVLILLSTKATPTANEKTS